MGIPSLIRFLKQIQESPMMAGSTTPGTQLVVPPPPPQPPVPGHISSHPPSLTRHGVSGALGQTSGILGLPPSGTTQPFSLDSTGGSVPQDSQQQQQLSAGSSRILHPNLLHQRNPHVQGTVKSDPSRASFVYLLPPDASNATFGNAAANAANGVAIANISENPSGINATQENTTVYSQQSNSQIDSMSNATTSSTLRLPIQLKMTASCMNTPAPPSNSQAESESLELSGGALSNPDDSVMPQHISDGTQMIIPSKQERIESCLGMLGFRNDDQSRSGSRATIASLGSFTFQQSGLNTAGVSPGSVIRMEQGVNNLAAQFSLVQNNSTSTTVTGISDINISANPSQTAGGGGNVIEGRCWFKFLYAIYAITYIIL